MFYIKTGLDYLIKLTNKSICEKSDTLKIIELFDEFILESHNMIKFTQPSKDWWKY